MINLKSVLTLILLLVAMAVLSQPGAPPATPIDGGLSLLLAAVGIYGTKKLISNKNSQKD